MRKEDAEKKNKKEEEEEEGELVGDDGNPSKTMSKLGALG